MSRAVALFILLFSFRSLADYTVGDALSDIYFESIHSQFAELESDVLKNKLNMSIADCRVYSEDERGRQSIAYRPGLGLCVFNHVLQKSYYPKQKSEIEAFAHFSNTKDKRFENARIVLRADVVGLPKRTLADVATFDIFYFMKLKKAFERWRDSSLEIEFPWRPVPLSQIVNLSEFSGFGYNLIRDRRNDFVDGALVAAEPMISKIIVKTTTVYPGEVEPTSCLALKSVRSDATKICVELKLFGNSTSNPDLVATLEKQIGLNPKQKDIQSKVRWFEVKAMAKDFMFTPMSSPVKISRQGMNDRLQAAELETELEKMQFELGINSKSELEP